MNIPPIIAALFLTAYACAGNEIICPAGAPANVQLAAKEIRRYVFLRSGELLPIVETGKGIALKVDPALTAQQYRLKSNNTELTISGGSDIGVLYGAYAFAEKLGICFQLDGDVIPDAPIPFVIPSLDEIHTPVFATRGLQPFHDFMEGPDWWNPDDYKAHLAQMAKMKMNFIGFHCYPRLGLPWDGQEPLVWTGLAGDFDPQTGHVGFSYPTAWATTSRRTWGNEPGATDQFGFGAAQLFDRNDYGADIMRGFSPMPKTPKAANAMFNRAGDMLKDVFGFSRQLHIKCWVGIELPLWIPNELRARITASGKNPDALATRQEIFDGTFRRIQAAYPADGFWFWTGERPDEAAKVNEELLAAHAAMNRLPARLDLGVCGWGNLASHFPDLHKALPPATVLSCINNHLGFSPVAPQFGVLGERPRFAIPWLEDDTNMTAPQLFVGRILKDAADAKRLGCNGLMGLHWRTRTIGPSIAALAQCGWREAGASGKPFALTGTEGPITALVSFNDRSLPAGEFYNDWCAATFGPQAGEAAARVFSRIDGRLPRPACWCLDGKYPFAAGPGLVGDSDPRPWDVVLKDYAFADEFQALRPLVAGPGNLDRFDYWNSQFQYLKAMGKVRCARAALDSAMTRLAHAAPASKPVALDAALTARQQLVDDWGNMMTRLLEFVSTPGELGTVANLELHSRKAAQKLELHDATLEKASGNPLPPVPSTYAGKPRIIVPTVRSMVNPGETLVLKIIALDRQPVKSVAVRLRTMGTGEWKQIPATHIARAVYEAKFPAASEDIEYHIIVDPAEGAKLVWPATAPQLNQTIVVTR